MRSGGDWFVANSLRSPRAGAIYTCVTTQKFLLAFGMKGRRGLTDRGRLQDSGLLG